MAKPNVETPALASSAVMSLPQPPLRNAEEYLKAYTGYVYTAVSAIAQEVASIDLHLYKAVYTKNGVETTEVYEHPVLSVLNYVNPIVTLYDILEATQIYLELTGEAFWVLLKQGNQPREAWLLRPDWVKITPSKEKIIDHYTYNPSGMPGQGVDIPPENMIHFKYFHPMNPYRGKGPVQSVALPFDILNFAQEYNRNFFFNSAIPSIVFTSEKPLNEATVKRFINQWQATYGGRSKSNKIAFLGNGMKLDRVGSTAQELAFTDQMRMLRDDILAGFKVPKSIIGLTDDVNRANAEATTIAFMERVVTPRMRKIVDCLNEFYLPMFGDNTLFFDFTDPAPADTEMKLKRYENALKYGWMTPNEVRAEENMEPVDGGDELPKPGKAGDVASSDGSSGADDNQGGQSSDDANALEEDQPKGSKGALDFLTKFFIKKEAKRIVESKRCKPKPIKHMVKVPVKRPEQLEREKLSAELVGPITKFVGELLALDKYSKATKLAKKKEDETTEKPKQDNVLMNEEQKVAYWRQFIQHITKRESELRMHAVDLFREQERMVTDNIDDNVKHWVSGRRKGKESSLVPSVTELSALWVRVWYEAVKEIYIEQGDYTLDFLGVGGHIDITTSYAAAYLQTYGGKLIREINETTRTQLMETLAEGLTLGEGIDKLKNRVKDVFKIATTSRAEMIARTEALKASNSATVEAYRQSGVVKAKEWLTERDLRTCPICDDMDGKTIGLTKNFFNSGETIEIGDSKVETAWAVGEPPLHPNCRCTTIPVLIGE